MNDTAYSAGDGPDGQCRIVRVQVEGRERAALVRGDQALDDADRAALGALTEAAERLLARRDPRWSLRQDLLRAARVAAACIPDGPIATPPHVRDGATVRRELRDAARAAAAALAAPEPRTTPSPSPESEDNADDRRAT